MAAIWIGIDDTDSPRGGCTTWVLTELVALARERGVDLLGEPRLVRLNPNVPWKTRGNAALAARFGHGRGAARRVGMVGGKPIFAYARGTALSAAESADLVRALWDRVREVAEEAPRTDPALVASGQRLPSELYWSAVREVVPVAPRVRALDRARVVRRTRGGRRGLVGASAAIAWPARRATWELITYREAPRWGTPRTVDPRSVRAAQRAEPELFLCYDRRTRRVLVAPHSPCPILFGLRATTPEAPLRALRRIRSEPIDRWMLFRTNQGTGDHLVRRLARDVRPYRSAIVDGRVASPPRAGPGGHVRFDLEDAAGTSVACLAFEPTKTLPRVARALSVGDRLRVWGSRGASTGLRLEGIRIVRETPRRTLEKPSCPACRRPGRSLGRHRGFECPGCGRRWPPEALTERRRPPEYPPGTYHPTASARRHLAVRAPEE